MPVMHRVVSIDDTNYVYIRPAIKDDHTTHDHTTFIHTTIYDLLVLLTWPTLPLYDDTTYAIQPTTSRSWTDQIYSHVFHPLHLTDRENLRKMRSKRPLSGVSVSPQAQRH